MRILGCLLLGGLIALPAWPQFFQAAPQFDLRADPQSPAARVVAGYLPAARQSDHSTASGHRYFYDEAARTYYGYDIIMEVQPGDRFRITYYDLSIGPLDFVEGPAGPLDPAAWKKLPLPAMPTPNTVKASEVLENGVFVDSSTGQRLIDSMYLAPPAQTIASRMVIVTSPLQFRTLNGGTAIQMAKRGWSIVQSGDFPIPVPGGTAREFSINDAQMSLRQARVTIDDVKQTLSSPLRAVSGSLVWFYVPKHGRYILSLSPRPELGFVQAGEVRGGLAAFTIGDEHIKLESPTEIAPGGTPYFLYVLHDADWEPTGSTMGGTLLTGSVSPAELAALARK